MGGEGVAENKREINVPNNKNSAVAFTQLLVPLWKMSPEILRLTPHMFFKRVLLSPLRPDIVNIAKMKIGSK